MITTLRTYFGAALVLLLVLTSQSMAVARGATGPAGQMVLCTGTGPVSVYVDENGAPTEAPHFCPDCALSVLDAVHARDIAPYPVKTFVRILPDRAEYHTVPPVFVDRVARGPPCSA